MSKWKNIEENVTNMGEVGDFTHRMEVPRGYLYRNIFISRGVEHVSMAFVPVSNCSYCKLDLLMCCVNCNDVTPKKVESKNGNP